MTETSELQTQAQAFYHEQQVALAKINDESPPDLTAQHFLSLLRHPCPSRGRPNSTTAIDLKEIYIPSADGKLAFLYREGTCKKCKKTARSKTGHVILAADRPPLEGRVGRA